MAIQYTSYSIAIRGNTVTRMCITVNQRSLALGELREAQKSLFMYHSWFPISSPDIFLST